MGIDYVLYIDLQTESLCSLLQASSCISGTYKLLTEHNLQKMVTIISKQIIVNNLSEHDADYSDWNQVFSQSECETPKGKRNCFKITQITIVST